MSFYTPLPGYEYPRNALLNFEPLANSIGQLGQAVQKRRKEQDFNALMGGQEFSENYQSPGGWQNTVTGTRPANPMLAGINPATLALARTAGYEQGLPMLARSIEHEQDRAFREREMRLREAADVRQGAAEERQAKLFGPQYQEAQIAAQLKQRELDAPTLKTGTVKEDEQLYSINPRTGDFKWVTPPNAQQNGQSKEYRKAYDKELGEAKAKATIDLPRINDNALIALQTVRDLRSHPGRWWATGITGAIGTVPGTDARGFSNLLEQAKGKVFLEAFNSLKGSGQISDAEGGRATQALARLDRAQTKEDFDKALNDLEQVIQVGLQRATRAASGDYAPRQLPAQSPQLGVDARTKQWSVLDPSTGQWRILKGAKTAEEASTMAGKELGLQQPQQPQPTAAQGQPSPAAINALRQNRTNAYILQQFDAKYGAGAAAQYLGDR